MIWVQLSVTLLLGVVLVFAWAHHSIERTGPRRAAELCLWLGPDIPFLIAALQLAISRQSASPANPTPISLVVPAVVLHTLLLVLAWRMLGFAEDTPARDNSLAAGLLILGSIIVWFAAIAWPGAELAQIAQHRAEHVFASTAFLSGALLTLAGFTIVNSLLEDAGDRILSRLGIVSITLGTVCWAIHLAFRLTVALSLAQVDRSKVPEWYPPMRMWAGAMYAVYMPMAYLAVAAFGAAMRSVGWISTGWGRAFIIFGLIATVGFLARAGVFDPPLAVNVMPYAAGVLLLRRNAQPPTIVKG